MNRNFFALSACVCLLTACSMGGDETMMEKAKGMTERVAEKAKEATIDLREKASEAAEKTKGRASKAIGIDDAVDKAEKRLNQMP